MRPQAGEKKNGLWFAAWALLVLVLLSTRLLAGLYARFVTSDVGADQARVASFQITANTTDFDDTFTISLNPQSQPEPYTLLVNNGSETAVRVGALLEWEGNLPLGFRYQRGDEAAQNLSPEEEGLSFSDSLAPGATGTYTILLHWDKGSDGEDYGYANGVAALRLRVRAEQID